jgi:glycosyltransferase domain-containing protein
MPRILLPTRNRPTALQGMLGYYARFCPGTRVIVADGSDARFQRMNETTVAELDHKGQIDYRPYPPEVGLGERLADVVSGESDPYFVMAADDDFPIMETFEAGAAFLDAHPDYVAYLGATPCLNLDRPDHIKPRYALSFPLAMDAIDTRLALYNRSHFQTTYGLMRREAILERARNVSRFAIPGHSDRLAGSLDLIRGKIEVVAQLGFIRTNNEQHSKVRQPLSPEAQREAAGRVRPFFRERLAEWLGHDEQQISAAVQQILAPVEQGLRKIPKKRPTRGECRRVMDGQIAVYRQLFVEGNAVRAAYEQRLRYIGWFLREVSASTDNAGEPRRLSAANLTGRSEAEDTAIDEATI